MSLRLASVKPPDLNPVLIVALTDSLPDEASRFGMGGVVVVHVDRSLESSICEEHDRWNTALSTEQQPASLHLIEVGAGRVDRGPDGHHHLDTHLL
jgi:hypothetical protein